MKKRRLVIVALTALLVIAAAGTWLLIPTGMAPGQAAMAEYRLEKLSCGSCVSNIEKSLQDLAGIGSVEVNLTSNRGRITFDPQQIDSRTIGATITAAGYPASLRTELSAAEYLALSQEQALLGQQYLARIGERLLARSDFEAVVQQRSAGATPEQRAGLRRSAWNEVLQRELLLTAAAGNGIIVQEGEVDARIAELSQQYAGFEQLIAQRYPDRQAFRSQLREDLIIQRNLEQHVFTDISTPQQRQLRFQQWYAGLERDTEVIIFDPAIKALTTGGSGCGSSCCG